MCVLVVGVYVLVVCGCDWVGVIMCLCVVVCCWLVGFVVVYFRVLL